MAGMILGFNSQFKNPILNKVKIHTIREDQKGRWKSGQRIHMATGVRSKAYDAFCTIHVCSGTEFISICSALKEVWVGGHELSTSEIETLAKNDGFQDVESFWKWFNRNFSGKIIH